MAPHINEAPQLLLETRWIAMSLKDVFQSYLNEMEWEDEIQHDEDANSDYIVTQYSIDDQAYTLQLSTHEDRQQLKIVMQSPISIPQKRFDVACQIVNFINARMPVGNLEIGENGIVYYRWSIDVEGSNAATMQFKKMVAAAGNAFDQIRAPAIVAAALTKQNVKEIMDDYIESLEVLSKSETQEDGNDNAPSSL